MAATLTDRNDVSGLIPESVATDILQDVKRTSVALQLIKNKRLSTKTTKLPVLASIPTASWVTGDTGVKGVTKAVWDKKYLEVEELATIVPIAENVVDDTEYGLIPALKEMAGGAISEKLDETIFFGTTENGKPDSFPVGLVPGAIAAGKVVTLGTATPQQGGLTKDVSQAFKKVEMAGLRVNGLVGSPELISILRESVDANGVANTRVNEEKVFNITPNYTLDGLWPVGESQPVALLGDFTKAIIGIRQDITYKLLTEATLEGTGYKYNLAQQDMVAIRVKARFAFVVANPVNFGTRTLNENQRYPFAVLVAPALVDEDEDGN